MPEGSTGVKAENSTSKGATDETQPIWHKYVTVAEEWDGKMMRKWEKNMNHLLFLAALFTAIITPFLLDALSRLEEDTSTKLLRFLAEQSSTGNADIPPETPPPFIVAVSVLWSLSIISSLAATTWAMLSLEWSAFLTEGVQAEDDKEMTQKRQLRFEAMKRWRVYPIFASIPSLFHISLFLFLAGLWLRLQNVNKRLGLIVGIPSLIIALSYVAITLLPMFTDAPFVTSVSEMVRPFAEGFRYLLGLCNSVHAPPIINWIPGSLASMSRKCFERFDPIYRRNLRPPLRIAAILLISTLKHLHKLSVQVRKIVWTVMRTILWLILPTFQPTGNLLKEHYFGPSHQDKGVYQRALFWLMNTPLTQSEVKGVLKELSNLRSRGDAEEPLDHVVVKHLVSCVSSILEDGRITEDERPTFDYYTTLLTEEMGRMFSEAKYHPKILVHQAAISNGLKEYVGLEEFGVGTYVLPPSTPPDAYDDYWNKAVRSLWFSPSSEHIQVIIEQLELNMQSMGPSLLRRVICGLHAATLTSLEVNEDQSIRRFPLPNLSKWHLPDGRPADDEEWTIGGGSGGDDWSPKKRLDLEKELLDLDKERLDLEKERLDLDKERLDLDKELSAFLQNLLTEFHKDAQLVEQKQESPTTIPSLIVACIELLDRHPQEDIPLEFHNILCSFVTVMWRSNPGVFDMEPSVAQALITSIEDLSAKLGPDKPILSKNIAVRLHTIANGPKYIPRQRTRETIANFYAGRVAKDPVCFPELIHVTAALLESVLVRDDHPGVPDWSHGDVRAIVPSSFFTDKVAFDFSVDHPDYRLPYVYSLAIALSSGIVEERPDPLEVLRLLRTPDGRQENTPIERILDTNALVVNVLWSIRRIKPVITGEELRHHLEQITQALQPLQGIIQGQSPYPRQTRWKAIYLLADIRNILPQELSDFQKLQSLIDDTRNAVEYYLRRQEGSVPNDWKTKREGLNLCQLEREVSLSIKRNEMADSGVYSRGKLGNIPYLSLYPRGTRSVSTPQASYRPLERLQQFIDADTSAISDHGNSTVNV